MKVGTKVCMKKDLGLNGNLFGGNMLAWMDEAAYTYARQKTGMNRLVTFKYGEILFKKPVKEGDMIDFCCHDATMGETSVHFHISAYVNTHDLVFKTTCVFVAVDEQGKKTKITGE